MPNTEYVLHILLGGNGAEGLGDGDDVVRLRGSADRLAEQLAAADPSLR